MADKGSISVAICAHNEEDTIGDLLEQTLNEEIPIKEIIVAVAGDDRTIDIVRDAAEEHSNIEIIEEKEREGQIIAQNKILSKAHGDLILMLDGDGTIETGSLEALYESYEEGKIVSGKEVPITKDSFTGRMIDVYGEAHHNLCEMNARFSTHLGIIPSNLVESFPKIVLDDAYIENRAFEEGLSIEYVEEAVKRHKLLNDPLFFFHQQRKNWAGRFQVERMGYFHTKSETAMLKAFFKQLLKSPAKLPELLGLAVVESFAYTTARFSQLNGYYPVKWTRPGKE